MGDLIERAEAALAGVTDGPWDHRKDRTITSAGTPLLRMYADRNDENNGRFVSAARQLVPDLIAAFRRVTAERDEALETCERLREGEANLSRMLNENDRAETAETEVARLTEAQKEASEAWPAVLALIREYDEAFPYAEGESDDAIVTRMNKAVSALNGGKTDD